MTAAEPAGEAVILELDRCAALDPAELGPAEEQAGAGSPLLQHRPRHPLVRTVGTAGVDALLRRHGVAGAPPWAEPVRLRLTERSLHVLGGRAGDRRLELDRVTAVVHSRSEPCTVLRGPAGVEWVLLVPLADADRLRAALDDALERAAVAAHREEGPDAAPAGSGPATAVHAGSEGPPPARRRLRATTGTGDRVFRTGSRAAGLAVMGVMALVGVFLLARAMSALRASGLSFLTTSEWQPDTHHFGIAAVLTGTAVIAVVALVVAVPLATGTALFISEVAPRRFRQWFVSSVDLMAAVPSVIYGLWGFKYLQPHVVGVARWLSTWCAWIPVFKVTGADPRNPLATASVYTASAFVAGLVVALMVIPISCSIMREVFAQAPAGEREGAYALGATRWGMIRTVVLPFGRGGMIGGVMLGLGRALGETIAVVLIISPLFRINWHILQTGANSVASLIVLRQGDASGFGLSALMAAGLALFVLTLVVNFAAAAVVSRSRSGAQSEA